MKKRSIKIMCGVLTSCLVLSSFCILAVNKKNANASNEHTNNSQVTKGKNQIRSYSLPTSGEESSFSDYGKDILKNGVVYVLKKASNEVCSIDFEEKKVYRDSRQAVMNSKVFPLNGTYTYKSKGKTHKVQLSGRAEQTVHAGYIPPEHFGNKPYRLKKDELPDIKVYFYITLDPLNIGKKFNLTVTDLQTGKVLCDAKTVTPGPKPTYTLKIKNKKQLGNYKFEVYSTDSIKINLYTVVEDSSFLEIFNHGNDELY